jgi:hypothetical protein
MTRAKKCWLVALAASLVAPAALAIEPPQPVPGTDPALEEPAKPAPAESPKAEDEEEKLPPLPADTVPSGPPPQRFNPTEKVRADFPVSFPIDI